MTDAIYEPSYEPYEGSRTSSARRVAAIARRGLGRVLRSTWFWVLLGISFVHVAVRGVGLYMTGQQGLPAAGRGGGLFTADYLASTLGAQARWIVTFVLAAVGAEMIAEDLENGGLTFYFTKPITKPGYLAGKLAAPFGAAFAVTALPMLVLWLLGVAFTPSGAYPDNVWLLPLLILAASTIASLMATLIVAALSALVSSRGRTAVAWVGLVIVLSGAARVTRAVTDNTDTLLIDLYNAVDEIIEVLLGVENGAAVSTWGAWATLAGWIVASLAALAWALQREEVAG